MSKAEAAMAKKVGVIGSDNANSIVLLVEHAGRKIILPGDLESPGLEDLLAELPIDCDVVIVGVGCVGIVVRSVGWLVPLSLKIETMLD